MKRDFLTDINYEIFLPPFGLNLYELTPKQAELNFQIFLEKIPERTKYLCERCSKDMKIPLEHLNFTPESLIIIWEWFIKTAVIVKTPKDEVALMKKRYIHLGEHFISKKRLSAITEFIIRDIGMYIGEVFRTVSASIEWELLTKPKNDFFYNHPVLSGFEDRSFTPPFKTVFEPVHMTHVQASRLLDGNANNNDLFNVYKKWLEYVH